jgi:hypothetical protein
MEIALFETLLQKLSDFRDCSFYIVYGISTEFLYYGMSTLQECPLCVSTRGVKEWV